MLLAQEAARVPPAHAAAAAAAFPPRARARALSAGPAVQRAARRGVPVGRVQPGAREPVGSSSIGGGLFLFRLRRLCATRASQDPRLVPRAGSFHARGGLPGV